uniref:Uncharacterized protein n=1 Tax=Rhizophora mucronata TaxID=61149 RepID=A0A2P2QJ53_RHIMU
MHIFLSFLGCPESSLFRDIQIILLTWKCYWSSQLGVSSA